jgi:hypothetical protein
VAGSQAHFRNIELAASICSFATMSDPVAALISRLSPTPVCDACIAERLNLGSPQIANLKVRMVAGTEGFERRRDICSLCFADRLVTRRV